MAYVPCTVENHVEMCRGSEICFDACHQHCLALLARTEFRDYHYPLPADDGLRQFG